MKKMLLGVIIALLGIAVSSLVFAQAEIKSQPFGGKLKLEGYAEYINFNEDAIDGSNWGGGILARYMFLDYLGVQTNFTFYSSIDTNKLGGHLNANNWRLTALLQAHLTDIAPQLYIYGGGGIGVQFNEDIGSISIDNAFTGHVLGGMGWDFAENFFLEGEAGYQFGNTDVSNYTKSNIDVDAFFARVGIGVKL